MICYEYPSSIITRVVLLVCLGQSCERLMAALIGSRRKAEPRNCLVESPLQMQTTAWRVVHSVLSSGQQTAGKAGARSPAALAMISREFPVPTRATVLWLVTVELFSGERPRDKDS